MYVEVIRRVLCMTELPTMIEIETADGILNTNGGAELREARQLLAEYYVVKVRKIKAADYGSISHRQRLVMVCVLKTFKGANDFEMPVPTWGQGHKQACANDVAVSDAVAKATMS